MFPKSLSANVIPCIYCCLAQTSKKHVFESNTKSRVLILTQHWWYEPGLGLTECFTDSNRDLRVHHNTLWDFPSAQDNGHGSEAALRTYASKQLIAFTAAQPIISSFLLWSILVSSNTLMLRSSGNTTPSSAKQHHLQIVLETTSLKAMQHLQRKRENIMRFIGRWWFLVHCGDILCCDSLFWTLMCLYVIGGMTKSVCWESRFTRSASIHFCIWAWSADGNLQLSWSCH